MLVARAIRDLTRALLICCAAVGVLGLAGVAILTLAPQDLTGLLPALTLLGLCQVFALVGGVVVGVGLRAALGTRRTDAGPRPPDAAAPADATPDDAARAAEASAVVARRLHLLARVVLVACVLAVAAWALADGAAAVGALLGALVGAQVAVVFVLLARRLVRA